MQLFAYILLKIHLHADSLYDSKVIYDQGVQTPTKVVQMRGW